MKRIFYLLLLIYPVCTQAQSGIFKYDVSPSVTGSYPQYLTVFGNRLFFYANNGTNIGWEPFIMDSAKAPMLIQNLNTTPGADAIPPSYFVSPACTHDGKLYFNGNNGAAGAEIYAWDGTGAPSLAADVENGAGGSDPDNLVSLGNRVYFKAKTAAEGMELWGLDPSSFALNMLTELNPGADSTVTGNLVAFKSNLYFTATSPATGNEVWMYDPVNDTVTPVADINPGPADSDPRDFVEMNGQLYFSANDGAYGRELFAFDGTNAPQRVTDINTGISGSIASYGVPHIAAYKNKLYFSATSNGTQYHMYCYDPLSGNATLAAQTNAVGNSDTRWLTVYAGKLYFNAYDTTHGFELWSYDAVSSPKLVADICPGKANGQPSQLRAIGNDLYFRANDCDSIGEEIFRYNPVAYSVQSIAFDGTVRLYPNPAHDAGTLEIKANKTEFAHVLLTDITGKTLWQSATMQIRSTTTFVQLPVSGLTSGTYFYQLRSETGRYLAGGKILKN